MIIFYFLFIFGLFVRASISQNVEKTTVNQEYETFTEKTGRNYEYCYVMKRYCEDDVDYVPNPTCVFQKGKGLTNFLGVCQVLLQECLNAYLKKFKDQSSSVEDEIYYNGKTFDCDYYTVHAKTDKQAVIWYFKIGGRDAEKEDIYISTKPFLKYLQV